MGVIAILVYIMLGCWAVTTAGNLFNESDSFAVVAAMLLLAVTILSTLFVPAYLSKWFFKTRK